MDWQLTAVGVIIAAAAAYVGRAILRSWRASRGGCGGCGCATKFAQPAQKNGHTAFVLSEQLTARLRQSDHS